MFKKLTLLFSIMIVLALVLTACGSSATEEPAMEDKPAAEEPVAEEPAEEPGGLEDLFGTPAEPAEAPAEEPAEAPADNGGGLEIVCPFLWSVCLSSSSSPALYSQHLYDRGKGPAL